jgi:predicted secreted hydrolase
MFGRSRRRLLAGLGMMLIAPNAATQAGSRASTSKPFAPVVPGMALRFPGDEGSHPDFRVEWWYITGWLEGGAKSLGFQITFFRTRPALTGDNPSAFTPRQILIAHAAISDPARGRLQHDQRIAREGFSLAAAGQGRVDVWIGEWLLKQEGGKYRARIPAKDFDVDFTLTAANGPLLQGRNGLSRKGPRPESASYYYSLPQLKVEGSLARLGRTETVAGTAWLDHEWSSSYMDKEAAGWDWIGINLDDGGALMAFRMRDGKGAKFWAGGSHRAPGGAQKNFEPADVDFAPLRHWRSPRTDTVYPVVWRIRTASMTIDIEPLFDDQENDTRASTGTIYWEGAVRALQNGKAIGRGYLELTGYWRRLAF